MLKIKPNSSRKCVFHADKRNTFCILSSGEKRLKKGQNLIENFPIFMVNPFLYNLIDFFLYQILALKKKHNH